MTAFVDRYQVRLSVRMGDYYIIDTQDDCRSVDKHGKPSGKTWQRRKTAWRHCLNLNYPNDANALLTDAIARLQPAPQAK